MMITPTVCVVGNKYQIMVVSEEDALISVRVGSKVYFHHSNGIRISSAGVHSFCVPAAELDHAKEYTVIVEKMLERLAYYPKIGKSIETTYKFKPIEKTENINIYHLADVHGMADKALGAAKFVNKEFDLLIMNGDISSTSDTFEDIILTYKITAEITKGEIPCVISRGNHDMRGLGAETLAKYMPGDNGKSYYTFRMGCIWGILVDTGEDKNDDNIEYNRTICCHDFRLEQEEMIKKVISNSNDEYADDGVKYKLVISHIPFTFNHKEPFNIERELYSRWSGLIKENIKPDLMLCGHMHEACVSMDGSEHDELGHPYPVVVGADLRKNEENEFIFAGAYINLSSNNAHIIFNTEKEIIGEHSIALQ